MINYKRGFKRLKIVLAIAAAIVCFITGVFATIEYNQRLQYWVERDKQRVEDDCRKKVMSLRNSIIEQAKVEAEKSGESWNHRIQRAEEEIKSQSIEGSYLTIWEKALRELGEEIPRFEDMALKELNPSLYEKFVNGKERFDIELEERLKEIKSPMTVWGLIFVCVLKGSLFSVVGYLGVYVCFFIIWTGFLVIRWIVLGFADDKSNT